MRRWAQLLVLGLVCVACGGGGASSASSPVDATSDSTVAGSGEGSAETLSDFFGGTSDPEEAEAEYREREARTQEAVRRCMAEEGFDYIPVEPPPESFAFDDTTQEEFAAKQGFGITTWIGNEEQFAGQESEWVDPNQEIVEAMSDSEREAYFEALYGSEEEQQEGMTVETDPDSGEEIYISEGFGPGCYGEAQEAEYGNQDDLWEELGPELEAMYERVQADPRIVEANQEWSTCMSEEGYDFESPESMYDSAFRDFEQRLEEIVGPNGGFVDPFEGWTEEEINTFFEEKSQDEIDAFFEQAQNQEPDYDEEALAALQQEEIDLAVASARCQSAIDEAFQDVYAEHEAEFIDQHREELERIKAAQDGSG